MHLRGGAVTAFALVHAAGGFDMQQRSAAMAAAAAAAAAQAAEAAAAGGGSSGVTGNAGLDEVLTLLVLGTSVLYAGQCMLVFGFAAAALEWGFSSGLVRRMRGVAFIQ